MQLKPLVKMQKKEKKKGKQEKKTKESKDKKRILIIGAGVTGLSLAWKLSEKGYSVSVIEREKEIGGLCTSFSYNNFLLDYGPHKFYPQIEEVEKDVKKLPIDLLEIKKSSKIRLQGRYFRYPLDMKEILFKLNLLTGFNSFLSYLSTTISGKKDKNYEEYICSRFGKKLYKLVFKENAEKIWGDPKNLSSDLAKTRISAPNLLKVALNAITNKKDAKMSAESFLYPKKNIIELIENIAKRIKENQGEIITNAELDSIRIKDKEIESVKIRHNKDKKKRIKTIKTSYLISTARLEDILPLLKATKEILNLTKNLEFRDLILIYIFLNKSKILKDNWIFFPEKSFIFQRVSEQKNFSSYRQPEDKTALITEISVENTKKINKENIKDIVIKDLIKAGFINREDVYDSLIIRKNKIYPVYSIIYKSSLYKILDWLDNNFTNFITAGRLGLFNYNNMDHCIDMASKIADYIINNKVEQIKDLRKYFESYKIVD